jgi:hypothetical protein
VTNLVTDLAGKAATTHSHVEFSSAGVGHTWFWGMPDGTNVQSCVMSTPNQVFYYEFTLPATITLRWLYARVGGTATEGRHMAWGVWNSAGSLVTNGTSSTYTIPAGGTWRHYRVAFPQDLVLGPGTYFLGWSSDAGASTALVGTAGTSLSSTLMWDGLITLGGLSESRMSFYDSSVSTGTGTITLPSSMGAASTRFPTGPGPFHGLRPLILGTP